VREYFLDGEAWLPMPSHFGQRANGQNQHANA
jgi:hypothetical protein